MRGDKIIRILEALRDSSLGSSDLLEAFLGAGYGALAGKMQYLIVEKKRKRQKDRVWFEEFVRERQKFHNLIYYLKSDGIISESVHGKGKWYTLAEKGRRKLVALLTTKNAAIPLPQSQYQKLDTNKFTIVAFDVPERERRKRDWLRATLGRMGYKTIQRSVLLGKTKIPSEFLDDLRKLHMVDYVEIFEITKTGSLRHLL